MVLKIFRVVWFLSVLTLFARLLYGYAGWAEELVIQAGAVPTAIGKDLLFYLLVFAIVVVNVIVYVIGKMFASNEDLRVWAHALVTSINIFLIVAISLISLYNDRFDYSHIGFIIYGSVLLVILAAAAWPIYLLYRKFFIKQVV